MIYSRSIRSKKPTSSFRRVYDLGKHFEFNREEFWTEMQNILSDEEFNILMMKMKDYSQDKMAGEMGVDRRTVPRKVALLREKLRPIKEKYFPHAKPLTAEDKRKMQMDIDEED